MSQVFLVLTASILMSSSVSLAYGPELPGCEVEGYSQECRSSNSTGTQYRSIPGCAISCPATKSPVCKPGYLSNDCNVPPTMPVCRCD